MTSYGCCFSFVLKASTDAASLDVIDGSDNGWLLTFRINASHLKLSIFSVTEYPGEPCAKWEHILYFDEMWSLLHCFKPVLNL